MSWAEILAMECAYNDDAEELEKYWNGVSTGQVMHYASALSPMEEFTDEFLDRLTVKNKVVVYEAEDKGKERY